MAHNLNLKLQKKSQNKMTLTQKLLVSIWATSLIVSVLSFGICICLGNSVQYKPVVFYCLLIGICSFTGSIMMCCFFNSLHDTFFSEHDHLLLRLTANSPSVGCDSSLSNTNTDVVYNHKISVSVVPSPQMIPIAYVVSEADLEKHNALKFLERDITENN